MVEPNMIGAYVPWASNIVGTEPGRLSLRRGDWPILDEWRETARNRLFELLAMPEIDAPTVTVWRRISRDGLHIEELSWQLPYGPPTRALFLKPEGATGPLPGILALHDHGGNKYFGCDKIAQIDDAPSQLMVEHRAECYGGRAWANEIARRGYAVLVPDAFPLPAGGCAWLMCRVLHKGLVDDDEATREGVAAYNRWAAEHESVMAKSLFCAGTTWPGVFLAEDRVALDILCARDDVDPERIGCGGLSGGGMRTAYLSGTDDRVRCAVCVGLMSTWRDYLLYKSHTHTWMLYVPLLPRDLDYPEILGLRAPLPSLVLNNSDDPLFTLPEMQRADEILAEVYLRADAEERYRCSFYPGPHKFDLAMQEEAFGWFDRWLQSEPVPR